MAELERPRLLILNQMAGPMTWELAEDLGNVLGGVALLTGHPDTLQKEHPQVHVGTAVPYERGSLPRRARSWVHYWLQALRWVWQQPAETPLLLYTNPPLLAWLGWLVHALRGTPYAVMVHDIYPDVLVQVAGVPADSLLVRAWRGMNRRAYERAALVITLGENMAATLARQFDARRPAYGSTLVAYPWVDTAAIKPLRKQENWFAQEQEQVDRVTVLYSGNMGLGHDLETMLAAARALEEETRIDFVFIGDGPKKVLVEEAVANGRANVRLLDWQPEEVFPYSLAMGDIALVSLDEGMEGLAIPSKAIYAMAAGSALVALVREGSELGTWTAQFGLGRVVEPGDTNGLVAALHDLAHNSTRSAAGANSRRAAEEAFSRSAVSRRIWRGLIDAGIVVAGDPPSRARG